MAKSKSQRMKEYRARKKEQLRKRWLKMERERIKGYFQPIEMLADDEKEKRRDKNVEQHKTDMNNNADLGEVNENPNTLEHVAGGSKESDDNGVSSMTNELSLTVELSFQYPIGVRVKGAGKRCLMP